MPRPDTRDVSEEPSYVCVYCGHQVTSLYVLYPNPSNSSLLQCPHCARPRDPYSAMQMPPVLLDLLLHKPCVLRHLLHNRGSSDPGQRSRERDLTTIKLGLIVLGLDAYVRCTWRGHGQHAGAFTAYAQTLIYCFLDALCLYCSVAISALLFLSFDRRQQPPSLHGHPKARIGSRTNYWTARLRVLPLAMLYSSIPTLFLLVVTQVIWPEVYHPPPSAAAALGSVSGQSPETSMITQVKDFMVGRWNLGGQVLDVFDVLKAKYEDIASKGYERGFGIGQGIARLAEHLIEGQWASEALLRLAVGGSSAVIAVSVLFGLSRYKAVLVVVVAWTLQASVMGFVDR